MQIFRTFYKTNVSFYADSLIDRRREANCREISRDLFAVFSPFVFDIRCKQRSFLNREAIYPWIVRALLRLNNARDEYRSFFELSTVNALDDCARKTFSFLSIRNTWKVFLDLGNLRFTQLQSLETLIGRNTEKQTNRKYTREETRGW